MGNNDYFLWVMRWAIQLERLVQSVQTLPRRVCGAESEFIHVAHVMWPRKNHVL